MGSYERILARLPMLYRPEPDETGLAADLLHAVGESLDGVGEAAQVVLQSHWFRHANKAPTSEFIAHVRRARRVPPPRAGDRIELPDLAALAHRLKSASDPLTLFLRGSLSAETRALLAVGEPPGAIQRALIDDLHRLITGPLIFEPARFAEVELSEILEERLTTPMTQIEITEVNVRLLEEGLGGLVHRRRDDQPYLNDLARLGALVGLRPRREPQDWPESAEEFRARVSRIVRLYRLGVGTRGAIERLVEAELPVDPRAPRVRAIRAFRVEEFSSSGPVVQQDAAATLRGAAVLAAVGTRGPPQAVLGPLMRWSVINTGVGGAAPTLYVEGIEASPPETSATRRPMIELFKAGGRDVCVGIAYDGDLPPGRTLRVRPAYATWLAETGAMLATQSQPDESGSADPAPIGPWSQSAGAPVGRVAGLVIAADLALWAAVEHDTRSALWRYDGVAWTEVAEIDDAPRAIVAIGDALIIATDGGLRRAALFPAGGAMVVEPADVLASEPIHAIAHGRDGLYVACDAGLFAVDASLASTEAIIEGSGVLAVHEDASGTLVVGGEFGLAQRRAGSEAWHALIGEGGTEQAQDWRRLDTDASGKPTMPDPLSVRLPVVLAIHRTLDGTIWLGTERGIVRYIARDTGPLAYDTAIEAFPDLVPGVVSRIRRDAHGVLWFATQRGVVRFDSREFSQRRGDAWMRLGGADSMHDGVEQPRGSWRYIRALDQWERLDPAVGPFTPYLREFPRTTAEPAAMDIAWTDEAVGDLGAWDGQTFTAEEAAPPESLVVRIKPAPTRVETSRFAAMPRVPPGTSTWRYLSMEEAGPGPAPGGDRPLWTTEGRLVPPPESPHAHAPGRFDVVSPPPASDFDESVWAYAPSARVWMSWSAPAPLGVVVRLERRFAGEVVDAPLLDRLRKAVDRVRPAGVRVGLAVEHRIVRGA